MVLGPGGVRRDGGCRAWAWLLARVVRLGPPRDSGAAHHERIGEVPGCAQPGPRALVPRAVVARKRPVTNRPLRPEGMRTAGIAWPGWVLGVWFDTALRGLRAGSPRTGVGWGSMVARKTGGSETPPLRRAGREGAGWGKAGGLNEASGAIDDMMGVVETRRDTVSDVGTGRTGRRNSM